MDRRLAEVPFVAGQNYSIADMAIWPWYGSLVLGRAYNAAEFLDVTSYKNVVAWAEKIDARPAVKRGRMVNKSWGDEAEQVPNRHSAADFAGKARIYSTPYADPMGKEYLKDQLNDYRSALDRKREMQSYSTPIDGLLEDRVVSYFEDRLGLKGVTGMRERGEERIANEGDFATLLDRSATRTQHGNPLAYLKGGGAHDYHEGIALFNVGFDPPNAGDRPGGADASYRSISLPQSKAPEPTPAPSGPVRLTE